MTETHKRANRHPKYKTAYRVKNWVEYDNALRVHIPAHRDHSFRFIVTAYSRGT